MTVRSRLRVRTRLRKIARRLLPARPRPLILMYHRVAHEPVDCYYMTVSPRNFRQHLEVLRQTRHPFTLDQFVMNAMSGELRQNAVALTFDDGYVDNLTDAKPLLAAIDVPATVFLTTGYIGCADRFWWDELARLVFFEEGPQSFQLVLSDQTLNCDFGGETVPRQEGTIRSSSLPKRTAVLNVLWQALHVLDNEKRQSAIEALQRNFGDRRDRENFGRAMTSSEVQALVEDGLVNIGAHSVTHPVLAGVGFDVCYREMMRSKLACEELIGKPVVAFSYPYGAFDAAACEAVKACNFKFACAKHTAYVSGQSDVFALPRVYVPNIDGDAFEQLLRSVKAVN